MWLNAVIWFVLGLVVGSFLNVVIYRIPRKIKLHDPSRSFCPHCGATIAWYDNIPLLSYLILKGRCRNCGDPISPRYPLVELLTALGFMAGGLVFDTMGALFNALVVASLVVLTFIDLETLTIPDTSVTLVSSPSDRGCGAGIGLPFGVFFKRSGHGRREAARCHGSLTRCLRHLVRGLGGVRCGINCSALSTCKEAREHENQDSLWTISRPRYLCFTIPFRTLFRAFGRKLT